MFGGPPEKHSEAEIKAAERETNATIQWTLSICAALYVAPFVVNYAQSLM